VVFSRRAFLHGVCGIHHRRISGCHAEHQHVRHHRCHYFLHGDGHIPAHWGALMACPCCNPFPYGCSKCSPFCVNGCVPKNIVVSVVWDMPEYTNPSPPRLTRPSISISGTVTLAVLNPADPCSYGYQQEYFAGGGLSCNQPYSQIQAYLTYTASGMVASAGGFFCMDWPDGSYPKTAFYTTLPCRQTGGGSTVNHIPNAEGIASVSDVAGDFCFSSGSASLGPTPFTVIPAYGTMTILDAY